MGNTPYKLVWSGLKIILCHFCVQSVAIASLLGRLDLRLTVNDFSQLAEWCLNLALALNFELAELIVQWWNLHLWWRGCSSLPRVGFLSPHLSVSELVLLLIDDLPPLETGGTRLGNAELEEILGAVVAKYLVEVVFIQLLQYRILGLGNWFWILWLNSCKRKSF